MASFGGWVNSFFNAGETAVAQPPAENGYGAGSSSSYYQPGSPAPSPATPAAEVRPSQTEIKLIAKTVRSHGDKKLETSWEHLMSEFEVQNRVWDSLTTAASGDTSGMPAAAAAAAAAAPPEQKMAQIKAQLNNAINTSQGDPKGAVALLKPLLTGQEPLAKMLNHSTEKATHAVVKASRLQQLCERLGQSLEAEGAGSQPKELESLLTSCQLQATLESKARRVLRLGPTKAEQAKADKQAKEAQQAALRATIQQLASAANVSAENAASALESANGDANSALTMLLSEVEEREARKAAKLAEKMEAKMAAREKQQQEKTREAASLANVVSKLAGCTVGDSWKKVSTEFEAQMKVWDSVATAQGNGAFQYQAIQQQVQGVLDMASQDPSSAVMLLETVLFEITSQRMRLTNGMMVAADGVLDASRIADYRRQLAARLRVLAQRLKTGETSDLSGFQGELKSLLQSCSLDERLRDRVQALMKASPVVVKM